MSYSPPKSVYIALPFEFKEHAYICNIRGVIEDGEPRIDELEIFIDWNPWNREKISSISNPLYAIIEERIPRDKLLEAMNSEYEAHYTSWGDHVYEQEKERRINTEEGKT